MEDESWHCASTARAAGFTGESDHSCSPSRRAWLRFSVGARYTFDRAVKFGSGWNPAGIPSFEWLEGMINQFRQTAERAGQGEVEVVLRAFTVVQKESPGGPRSPMMGTLDKLREDTRRLRDMGVTHLIQSPAAFGFDPRASSDDMLAVMEQLIEVSK